MHHIDQHLPVRVSRVGRPRREREGEDAAERGRGGHLVLGAEAAQVPPLVAVDGPGDVQEAARRATITTAPIAQQQRQRRRTREAVQTAHPMVHVLLVRLGLGQPVRESDRVVPEPHADRRQRRVDIFVERLQLSPKGHLRQRVQQHEAQLHLNAVDAAGQPDDGALEERPLMHRQWTSDGPVALILLSAQLLVLAPNLPRQVHDLHGKRASTSSSSSASSAPLAVLDYEIAGVGDDRPKHVVAANERPPSRFQPSDVHASLMGGSFHSAPAAAAALHLELVENDGLHRIRRVRLLHAQLDADVVRLLYPDEGKGERGALVVRHHFHVGLVRVRVAAARRPRRRPRTSRCSLPSRRRRLVDGHGRQVFYRRVREDLSHRYLQTNGPCLGHDSKARDGVTAEVEEALVDADRVRRQAQHGAPILWNIINRVMEEQKFIRRKNQYDQQEKKK